jgi:glycosyltransferase involved in cell wall biosynthesis
MVAPMPTRVLVITPDPVGPRMSGPAIRAWELARQLAAHCTVPLACKFAAEREGEGFAVTSYPGRLSALVAEHDVLVAQGATLYHHPELMEAGKYLVVDLYAPLGFESYPNFGSQGSFADAAYGVHQEIMDGQMLAGDFFLCASERQRDMWLGRFCGLKRLRPAMFELDPSFEKLLALVPFGVADRPPTPGAPVMRGVLPGVTDTDTLLLWGGGIWDWFDPLTLIRAVAGLGRADVKLVFMGLSHPNPDIAPMAMASRAVALAEELGVKDRLVFFNHGWVDYDERARYLLEADAGVSVHFDSVETRFSYRTRVLDYLWAGLPVLTTRGDAMAELVAREGLGEVLDYQDVAGWQAAIARLAPDPARRARVLAVAERLRWSEVAKPLVTYCQAPYHTPRGLVAPTRPAPPLAMWAGQGLAMWRRAGARARVAKLRLKFTGRPPSR